MISKKKEKKKILPSLVQFLTDKIGNSCMTRIIYERGVLFFSRKNRSSYLWSSIKGKKKGKKARNHGRSRNSGRNITHRLKFARFTPDIRAIKGGGPSPPLPFFSIRLQNRTTGIVFYDNAAKPVPKSFSKYFVLFCRVQWHESNWMESQSARNDLRHFHNVNLFYAIKDSRLLVFPSVPTIDSLIGESLLRFFLPLFYSFLRVPFVFFLFSSSS